MGYAVALDGDVAVVSAPRDGTVGDRAGALYVFRRGTNGFEQEAMLTVPGSDGCDDWDCSQLGLDVDVDGDALLAVGANIPFQDDLHFFERDASGWSLVSSFPEGFDYLPRHPLSISGERAAFYFPGTPARVHLYERGASDWAKVGSLPALGIYESVALDDNYLLPAKASTRCSSPARLTSPRPHPRSPSTARPCPTRPASLPSLVAGGCTSATAGELRLRATPVPNEAGIFFFGPTPAQIPFGDGWLCITGGILRLPVVQAAGGALSQNVFLGDLPFAIGDVWNVQGWFRDPAAGGAGFNLTDALTLTVGP